MKRQIETCPSVNGFSHNIFYSSIAAILNFNFRLATFLCNNCYLFVFQEQKKIHCIPCRTLNSHSVGQNLNYLQLFYVTNIIVVI